MMTAERDDETQREGEETTWKSREEQLGDNRETICLPKYYTSHDGRYQLSLKDTEIVGEGLDAHCVYAMDLCDLSTGETWVVRRRFRQFYQLREDLKDLLIMKEERTFHGGEPELPPREPLQLHGGRNAEVMRKRQSSLGDYLGKLLRLPGMTRNHCFASFLELTEGTRGICAFARKYGTDVIVHQGYMRVREWFGKLKPCVNIFEAGLGLGWKSVWTLVVRGGPIIQVYLFSDPEDDPDKPWAVLPEVGKHGKQEHTPLVLQRVEVWGTHPNRAKTRLFALKSERRALLCQLDSEAALQETMTAIDAFADLRPQQTDSQRLKTSIELKARKAWENREDIFGGL